MSTRSRHDLERPGAADARLARLLEQRLGEVAGWVLPLKPRPPARADRRPRRRWRSSRWPLRRERLYLIAGDSPIGLRLPLASLPEALPDDMEPAFAPDPFAPRAALRRRAASRRRSAGARAGRRSRRSGEAERRARSARGDAHRALRRGRARPAARVPAAARPARGLRWRWSRRSRRCAGSCACRCASKATRRRAIRASQLLQRHARPRRHRGQHPPGRDLARARQQRLRLYEEARQSRLGTEKFMLDGRHTGTGGGNHVTSAAPPPADSPLLRRPDLLQSLIAYWQNHPSLSYLFSGCSSVRPARRRASTRRATTPLRAGDRVPADGRDAARRGEEAERPWLVDRLLRNLLVDLTGNTHRAEFSIDKLYSPDSADRAARPGRVPRVRDAAARADEPGADAAAARAGGALLEAALPRATDPLGHRLHDRFMLPHFVAQRHPRRRSRPAAAPATRSTASWFDAVRRVPLSALRHGRRTTGIELELRQAIEPWHVLGEEVTRRPAPSRYVDSSVERLQVKVRGLTQTRHVVDLQRPRAAAAADRRARRVRRRRALPRLGAAVGACIRPSACTRR